MVRFKCVFQEHAAMITLVSTLYAVAILGLGFCCHGELSNCLWRHPSFFSPSDMQTSMCRDRSWSFICL